MGQCHFGNIILPKSGKNGILKPDSEGYYTLNGGGFNIPNRNGITYSFNDYIATCMGDDSDFARRLKRGEVQGEMGHPPRFYLKMVDGKVVRHDIATIFEWILRLRTIDQDRVCMLISDVFFKWENENSKTSPLYVDYRVKPFGVFGHLFKDHLDTPSANTSISIRTVISPTTAFDKFRNVEYWTGSDWVPEPGMDKANKWSSAGCEGLNLDDYLAGVDNGNEDNSVIIVETADAIKELAKSIEAASHNPEFAGCESFDAVCEIHDRLKKMANEVHTVRSVSAMSIF